MKQLLSLILCFAIVALPLRGMASEVDDFSTMVQVASGTVTLANAKISATDGGSTASGGSFIDFGSMELVTNGTAWTGATGATPPTGWSVGIAGTFTIFDSGDGAPYDACLKISHNGTNNNPYIYSSFATVVGQTYKFSTASKNVDATSRTVGLGTSQGGTQYFVYSGAGTTWVTSTKTFVATTTTTYVYLQTATSTNAKYACFDSISITPYYTPFQNANGMLLEVTDSAGKKISGWIKAAGTGETTGAELGTDPGFAAVTKAAAKSVTGITKANPGVVTFAAGHGYANGDIIYFSGLTQMTELNTQYWQLRSNSGDTFQLATVYDTTSLNTSAYGAAETTGGNCAQKCTFTSWTQQGVGWVVGVNGAGALTNTLVAAFPGDNASIIQIITGVNLGLMQQAYTVTTYVSGANRHVINGTGTQDTSHTTADTFTVVRTQTVTSSGIVSISSSNFRGIIDNFTKKQILTPSTTGCTLVSQKGGTLYNMAFKDAAFNYASTTFTYRIFKSLVAPVVASGTVTQANTHLDLTADNAFAWLNGVDLSPYADGRHMIGIYGATDGKGLLGHISSVAAAGETLSGTELVTNPDMELDASWNSYVEVTTNERSSTQKHGGTYSRHIVTTNGASSGIQNSVHTETVGQLFKEVNWNYFVSGTLKYGHPDGNGSLNSRSFVNLSTTINTWVQNTKYRTSESSGTVARPAFVTNYSVSEWYIDDVSVQRVTDPPSTGVRIVSTQKGAVRAWIVNNGINPNDVSGVTYKIFQIGD